MSEKNEVTINIRVNTDKLDKDLEIAKSKIIEVSEFAVEKNVNLNLCLEVMLEKAELKWDFGGGQEILNMKTPMDYEDNSVIFD